MARRLIDLSIALAALVILSPLFALAAIGIRLSSCGPVLFRAKRVGLNGKLFRMYKFRTMHLSQEPLTSRITASDDHRVFAFGAWLRRMKIDELPQLLNVLKGEMSIVGPRPEDPEIVEKFYAPAHFETLRILPGLASPGSLYNYTHGEQRIESDDPERCYVELLLPVKLALDIAYVREASLLYDLKIMLRTVRTIAAITIGTKRFPDPPELEKATRLMYPLRHQ
jgi:lipopolysaccharide/colanic/teichoic acid biosynthesis glycosyltransferase